MKDIDQCDVVQPRFTTSNRDPSDMEQEDREEYFLILGIDKYIGRR